MIRINCLAMKRPHYDYRANDSAANLLMELPRPTLKTMITKIRAASSKAGLTYIDEQGKVDIIPITLRPRLISPEIHRAIRDVVLALNRSFEKIAFLYRDIPEVRPIFPFTERENSWVEDIVPNLDPRLSCVASRWDANTGFGKKDWRESFCFFEVNGVGIGGLWYAGASADLLMRFVVPELKRLDPAFRVRAPKHGMHEILFRTLAIQKKRLGKTRGAIALMMDKAEGTNYVEFERLARFYSNRGVKTILCGPADLRLKGDDLFVRGQKIDLVYRDTQLSEFCAFEEKGFDLYPVRRAFQRSQLVSTFEGEFDHKSAFEVFTDPKFYRYFTVREVRLFKKYILWTRLLREVKSRDLKGRAIDLVPYALKHQGHLVLKPNRSFGGKGIVFGSQMTRRAWEQKVEGILQKGEDWVIQEEGIVRKKRFLNPRSSDPQEAALYVVSGFFAAANDLAIVGRVSRDLIVNVAQGGGLSPVLLVA